jgi:TM2 domain-containing membrane protein YozV
MTTAGIPAQKAAEQASQGLGLGAFFMTFVPGLLQLQLGQKGRALIAFVSSTALFFVGWSLVQDRLFAFSLTSSEPGGSWLPARIGIPLTLPEILNLPALAIGGILSYASDFESMRAWYLPRPMEDLGGFLTAASGMLAAFWGADGIWSLRWRRDAKDGVTNAPVCNPALAAGLSWLLPGAGHAIAGQRDKGVLMGNAVFVVFAVGMWCSDGHAVDRQIASVWWIGQALFGGGALFASLVTAPIEMTSSPDNLELGTNLCTVAGLMNLVVMIDAFTVAERSSFPVSSMPAEGGAA